jgi:hypothetical protein
MDRVGAFGLFLDFFYSKYRGTRYFERAEARKDAAEAWARMTDSEKFGLVSVHFGVAFFCHCRLFCSECFFYIE